MTTTVSCPSSERRRLRSAWFQTAYLTATPRDPPRTRFASALDAVTQPADDEQLAADEKPASPVFRSSRRSGSMADTTFVDVPVSHGGLVTTISPSRFSERRLVVIDDSTLPLQAAHHSRRGTTQRRGRNRRRQDGDGLRDSKPCRSTMTSWRARWDAGNGKGGLGQTYAGKNASQRNPCGASRLRMLASPRSQCVRHEDSACQSLTSKALRALRA